MRRRAGEASAQRLPGFAGLALLAALLVTVEVVIAQSTAAERHTLMSTAITVDLALGFPLLAYLLLVRRGRFGLLVLVPFLLVGALVARLVAPQPDNPVMNFLELALPALELGVIAVGIWKLRRLLAAYRLARPTQPYPFDAFRLSVERVFGRSGVARAGTMEAAFLAFGLGGWRRIRPEEGYEAFPTHRRAGYVHLVGIVAGLVAVETVGVHLVVSLWSPVTAWVLTGLALYSLLWILGDLNAVRLSPHRLDQGTLHLRVGFRWAADVPLDRMSVLRLWAEGDVADSKE